MIQVLGEFAGGAAEAPCFPVKKAPGAGGAAHPGSLPVCSGPPRRGAQLTRGLAAGETVPIVRITRIT